MTDYAGELLRVAVAAEDFTNTALTPDDIAAMFASVYNSVGAIVVDETAMEYSGEEGVWFFLWDTTTGATPVPLPSGTYRVKCRLVDHDGLSSWEFKRVRLARNPVLSGAEAVTGGTDGMITSRWLAEGAVTDGKIADATITEDKLAFTLLTGGDIDATVAIEAALREAGDETLQASIDAETATRVTSDTGLSNAITAEQTARANADDDLAAAIDAEADSRSGGDISLQITIQSETDARVLADSALQTNLNSEATTRATADTNEASARVAGDALKLAKAANLSDLANRTTARTNLGLGDAAELNVGTTVGTVAAGDDARFSVAAGPAGGVLSGTYPDPGFAVDMATQAELDAHAVDTTSVHGIADTTVVVITSDARLTDARTPTAHAASHKGGGSDVIANATSSLAGLMSSSDKTKLDGVEASATADQTAAEILTAIKTVDGSGSGLDADLLDGHDTAYFEVAGTAGAAITTHVAASDPHGDRAYTDAQVASQISTAFDFKASVRAATAANISLSGTQTIDGVAVVAGNRVLVKNQTTASQNGIYVAASGSWARSADADADAEVTGGLAVAVVEGTVNAGRLYMLSTPDAITVGSTALTFTRVDAGTLAANQNLSDLSSVPTARNNLGLGGAATLSVGTTAGTVAAGDDSRLTDARTPTSHASTHKGGGSDAIDVASTSLAGLMSATDKTKLDGIESGATADQTATEILTAIKTVDGSGSGLDADLLDGHDTSYFVAASDLTESVEDTVGAMVVAGDNVTATYNDSAGTLTIAASGGTETVTSDTIAAGGPVSDDFNRANETPVASPYGQMAAYNQFNLSSSHLVGSGADSAAVIDTGVMDTTFTVDFNVASGNTFGIIAGFHAADAKHLLFFVQNGNWWVYRLTNTSVDQTVAVGSGATGSGAVSLRVVATGDSYEFWLDHGSGYAMLWSGTVSTWTRTTGVFGFRASTSSTTVEAVTYESASGGSSLVTIDASVGSYWDIAVEGDGELALAGAVVGVPADLTVVTRQDATGGHAVTLPTVDWVGGVSPAPSTGANAIDVYRFVSVDGGVSWQGAQITDVASFNDLSDVDLTGFTFTDQTTLFYDTSSDLWIPTDLTHSFMADVDLAGLAKDTVLAYDNGTSKWKPSSGARPWVNVFTAGAVGDGTTDDTAAFQTILDNHRIAYVPPGHVFAVGQLHLKSGSGIIGDNSGGYIQSGQTAVNSAAVSKLLLLPSSNSSMLSLAEDECGVLIKDVELDGNDFFQATAANLINLPNVSGSDRETRLEICRCWVHNSKGRDLYVGSGRLGVIVTRSELTNAIQEIAYINGTDFRMNNCFVGIGDADGIKIAADVYSVTDTEIFACDGAGIVLEADRGFISGSVIDRNGGHGAYIASGTVNVKFAGCTFHTNSINGNGASSHVQVKDGASVHFSQCQWTGNDGGVTNKAAWCVDVDASTVAVNFVECTREAGAALSGTASLVDPSGLTSGSAVVRTLGRTGTAVAGGTTGQVHRKASDADYDDEWHTLIAADVVNVAAGNISSTTVQAALNELDTEKALASRARIASPSLVATLGSDLLTNGAFTSNLSGWTVGTNWAYNAGTAQHTAGNTATLDQSVSGITSGAVYSLTVTITGRTAGSVIVSLGATASAPLTATSTIALAAAATGSVTVSIAPTTDFDGSIDSITLQLVSASTPQVVLTDSSDVTLADVRADLTNSNVGVGSNANRYALSGGNNTALGANANATSPYGSQNTAIGSSALRNCTTGAFSTAVGASALLSVTSGASNVGVGYRALRLVTTASQNTAVGALAATAVSTGANNTAIGSSAAAGTTTASDNTIVGFSAASANVTGASNVVVGSLAFSSGTSSDNTMVGYRAGLTATDANGTTSGARQTLYGRETGVSSTSQRDDIVALGYRALCNGNNAIAIGSGASAGAAGAVAIGKDSAGTSATTTTTDEILLGTATQTCRIPGTLTGLRTAITATKTSAYAATATDVVIPADASSAAFSVTLPTAASVAGRTYTIKRTNSGVNVVTVATTSSQTIDGATTYSLNAQYQSVTVISDGANWMVI